MKKSQREYLSGCITMDPYIMGYRKEGGTGRTDACGLEEDVYRAMEDLDLHLCLFPKMRALGNKLYVF